MGKLSCIPFINIKKGFSKKQGKLKPQKNSLQQVIQYEQYALTCQEYIYHFVTGAGICGLLAYTFYRSILIFLCFLPIGILYPFYKKRELKKKRLEQLGMEFKEAILILAGALSAGYSVENAFRVAIQELLLLYGKEGLITREFYYIEQQMRVNRPVEQVLWELGERSGLEDIRNFAEVFSVAKRGGGELVSIMNHTAQMIGEKMQVKEEIRTLTASKQFEQKIMNLIPFLIVFYIDLTSPGFFNLMYTTGMGRVLMTICMMLYLVAYETAEWILKIQI